MTETIFTDYIKSYIDNGITVPDYVKDVISSNNLDTIKIYNIGLDYLRKGLVHYAKPILKTLNINIEC